MAKKAADQPSFNGIIELKCVAGCCGTDVEGEPQNGRQKVAVFGRHLRGTQSKKRDELSIRWPHSI